MIASKDKEDLDREILIQVVANLESTTQIMQTLIESNKENTALLATMQADMRNMCKELDLVSVIVRGNNGNDSITNRISILDHRMRSVENAQSLHLVEEKADSVFARQTVFDFLKLAASGIVGGTLAMLGNFLINS
ncbi:MAG: hypothetical protein DRQ40_01990 [Gammaproteobacteria bacterium]|nr:MAG: hypothetical protein DRQ40_01990 [Gammaproteobacteria bacterium]